MRTLLNLTLFVFCLSLETSHAAGYGGGEIAEMEAGLARWRKLASEASTMPPQEAMHQLGTGLYKTSLTSIYVYGDREGVRKELQKSLLSIPGHAEYFGGIVRRKFEEEIARKSTDRERMSAFATLDQLPSPETVKVLGELLYDDRNPWDPKDFYDTGPPIPNFKRASMALTRLGIRRAPVKNTNPYRSGFEDTEAHTWKLWYEQVRDGSRTFSFEGDEAVYNLSGPVSPEKPAAPTRPDRKPSLPVGKEVSHAVYRVPLITAIILLAGMAAFTILKMKRGSGEIR